MKDRKLCFCQESFCWDTPTERRWDASTPSSVVTPLKSSSGLNWTSTGTGTSFEKASSTTFCSARKKKQKTTTARLKFYRVFSLSRTVLKMMMNFTYFKPALIIPTKFKPFLNFFLYDFSNFYFINFTFLILFKKATTIKLWHKFFKLASFFLI